MLRYVDSSDDWLNWLQQKDSKMICYALIQNCFSVSSKDNNLLNSFMQENWAHDAEKVFKIPIIFDWRFLNK